MLVRPACFAASLFLACTASTLAEAYDPSNLSAREIFDKALAAYGSFDNGVIREVSTVSGGGTVRTVTTYSSGGEYKTVVAGGGFTRAHGTVEGHIWSRDANGIVTIRNGFHGKTDPNILAYRNPGDPKYNVRVLGVTRDTPRSYVVDLNPPGGYDEQRYYDATTFLIRKIVRYTRDRYRHVTEYGDYRTVLGETLAFTTHSYDGRPQNDTAITVVSVDKTGTPGDLAMPSGTRIFHFDGTAPVTLPARFTRQGIIVRAVVNGRGLDFLLDSGAGGLYIDSGVAHELGLTPYGRYSETVGGGDVDMGDVRLAHMSIGSLDLDNVVFTVSPYTEEIDGSRVVGLIGFDFLASGIFKLDFKAGTLTILPRDGFAALVARDTALPLQLDDSVPRADVWVEGVHGHFMVDTGATGVLMYKDFVDRLPDVVESVNRLNIMTVGGAMSSKLLDMHDLVFGGVKFANASAIEPVRSTFDVTNYDGLVGRGVLSLFTCYLDYADGMLYTQYNP